MMAEVWMPLLLAGLMFLLGLWLGFAVALMLGVTRGR
jgi:hypothetical protein